MKTFLRQSLLQLRTFLLETNRSMDTGQVKGTKDQKMLGLLVHIDAGIDSRLLY